MGANDVKSKQKGNYVNHEADWKLPKDRQGHDKI